MQVCFDTVSRRRQESLRENQLPDSNGVWSACFVACLLSSYCQRYVPEVRRSNISYRLEFFILPQISLDPPSQTTDGIGQSTISDINKPIFNFCSLGQRAKAAIGAFSSKIVNESRYQTLAYCRRGSQIQRFHGHFETDCHSMELPRRWWRVGMMPYERV